MPVAEWQQALQLPEFHFLSGGICLLCFAVTIIECWQIACLLVVEYWGLFIISCHFANTECLCRWHECLVPSADSQPACLNFSVGWLSQKPIWVLHYGRSTLVSLMSCKARKDSPLPLAQMSPDDCGCGSCFWLCEIWQISWGYTCVCRHLESKVAGTRLWGTYADMSQARLWTVQCKA